MCIRDSTHTHTLLWVWMCTELWFSHLLLPVIGLFDGLERLSLLKIFCISYVSFWLFSSTTSTNRRVTASDLFGSAPSTSA